MPRRGPGKTNLLLTLPSQQPGTALLIAGSSGQSPIPSPSLEGGNVKNLYCHIKANPGYEKCLFKWGLLRRDFHSNFRSVCTQLEMRPGWWNPPAMRTSPAPAISRGEFSREPVTLLCDLGQVLYPLCCLRWQNCHSIRLRAIKTILSTLSSHPGRGSGPPQQPLPPVSVPSLAD